MHPFNKNEQLDEVTESYFKLTLPLLNFRIGLQGFDKSFSFVISDEDLDYRGKTNMRLPQIMTILEMSRQVKQKKI